MLANAVLGAEIHKALEKHMIAFSVLSGGLAALPGTVLSLELRQGYSSLPSAGTTGMHTTVLSPDSSGGGASGPHTKALQPSYTPASGFSQCLYRACANECGVAAQGEPVAPGSTQCWSGQH